MDADAATAYCMNTWTILEAIALCVEVEDVCEPHGCHVALTGGCLYRRGERKDLDLVFYRIRQCETIDMTGLWQSLEKIGVQKMTGFGWCHKAKYKGKSIDCLFPEEKGGTYPEVNEPPTL